MESFTSHRGKLATLNRANVDTDAIIPKQFLKSIHRTGYGENLFFDWRYLADGSPHPDFELNKPHYESSSILVTRNNFGCGSSREHAVWAIKQYGFCAIIAPRLGDIPAFADIFHNNAMKNGLLCIELTEAQVEEVFQMAERYEGLEVTVNLEEQRVTLHLPEELSFHFEIDKTVKEHLVAGLDDIGLTLKDEDKITDFEKTHSAQKYWLTG